MATVFANPAGRHTRIFKPLQASASWNARPAGCQRLAIAFGISSIAHASGPAAQPWCKRGSPMAAAQN